FKIQDDDASWYNANEDTDIGEYVPYLNAYGPANITAERIVEKLQAYEKEVRLVFASTAGETELETMSIDDFAKQLNELAPPGKIM
ncbi:hypothetical protein MTO96_029667, partial [Rhipicephalus appendiculatus]